MPVLMKLRSSYSSDTRDFGEVVSAHMKTLQATYGTTFLAADSALDSAENLQKPAETRMRWIHPCASDVAPSASRAGPSRALDDAPSPSSSACGG
jgi:hypothetical protein